MRFASIAVRVGEGVPYSSYISSLVELTGEPSPTVTPKVANQR
jgi:hypothetical protein